MNTNKAKCITFNKWGRYVRNFFTYNNIRLKDISTFRYLGFLISNNGNIKKGLSDLKDRALEAFYSLELMLGTAFWDKPTLTMNLVDIYISKQLYSTALISGEFILIQKLFLPHAINYT